MKLSTKGRYGLRAMLDLAIHSKETHVALFSIAERQDVSENYLEQVFATLRKAGLVKSIKGAQGGYVLADQPANIRIGTILRALEGDLSITDTSGAAEDPAEDSIQYCIQVNVWDRINESINNLVDAMTLEDLVDEYNKLNTSSGFMYYI